MNIVFVLFDGVNTNSGFHVASLVEELVQKGHECVIAVPRPERHNNEANKEGLFRVVTHREAEELLARRKLFRNGKPADILHAWTPRELVRKCCERLQKVSNALQFVHLEDNEDYLVQSFLGDRVYRLASSGVDQADFPDTLTHPLRGRIFLRSSHGVTMLIDAMREKTPPEVPACVIWPAADSRVYYPRDNRDMIRSRYNLPASAVVLVYTGNTHPANFREVRSLYLAVHLLNHNGVDARLVRTGKDVLGVDPQYHSWARQYSLELGFLDSRKELGELLAMADVLVQPGKNDAFNQYRFPSKLPEFFASGRPVVLPRSNIGLITRHLEDAYVLPNADGPAIAKAVEQIIRDPALSAHLAKGARAFYTANLSWQLAGEKLMNFYEETMSQVSKENL